MKFNTKLLHGAFPTDGFGATIPPVYQVSAFAHESAEKLERVFDNKAPGFAYTRISNPTVLAFEKRMAALEGGVDAVACASGMAAVAMALLGMLQSGDEILAGSGLFGGTLDLLEDFRAFGITVRYAANFTAQAVEEAITEKTRAIFCELIGNPKLDVVDLRAISAVARRHGIPFVVDSTTATPVLVRPLALGADVVVHSSSKYINGSSNAISGVIVDGGHFDWDFKKYAVLCPYKKFGKLAYTARLRQDIWRNFGACLSPQNAFYNCLGLETLGLRMERLCENARRLAEHLAGISGISVNYPGLAGSPYKALTETQFGGAGGAIFTLRVGTKQKAFAFMNALKYALIATNIGDVRTLVIHPASTIYQHASDEQKAAAGVYEDMVRVSVGIEDIVDLMEDFTQALGGIGYGSGL